MNQITTKWLNPSITASETGGKKTIPFLKPLNSEGVELQALFRKFDPFRIKIADIDPLPSHGLHLPTGKGRPVVIIKFNPFRIGPLG